MQTRVDRVGSTLSATHRHNQNRRVYSPSSSVSFLTQDTTLPLQDPDRPAPSYVNCTMPDHKQQQQQARVPPLHPEVASPAHHHHGQLRHEENVDVMRDVEGGEEEEEGEEVEKEEEEGKAAEEGEEGRGKKKRRHNRLRLDAW